MDPEDFPAPRQGVIITHFLVVRDQDASRDWYRDVFGAKVVRERDPVILRFENSWLILNVGGGPTDDKPNVTLEPPSDPSRTSAFLNLRVADIQQVYEEWSARGAQFLTPRSTGERRSAAISETPTATSSRSDSPPAFFSSWTKTARDRGWQGRGRCLHRKVAWGT